MLKLPHEVKTGLGIKNHCKYIIITKIKLTPEYLIEKNFHMIRAEWLWRDDNLVEVTLKQLCDYISDIRDVKDLTGCNKVNC